MTSPPQARTRRTAFVLSGGGARGAYEVGVLSYLFGDLARQLGGPPRIDILCGTSVGAINACYLAAHLSDSVVGIRRLADLWRGIQLDDMLGFSLKQAFSIPKLLRGGDQAIGLVDVTPIANLVAREIPWTAISRSLRRGELQSLSVTATEVSTGRTVLFVQTGPDGSLPITAPPRTVLRSERIGPPHALASAAIPLIFPPVRVGGQLYVDGGLRQNTPIAPAIRFGATHVFAIGLSREVRGIHAPEIDEGKVPGAAFLLGKVLNAFLLDHINADLDLLDRINSILDDGEAAFGEGFREKISSVARDHGRAGYRRVEAMAIRPSEDLGRLAADHMNSGKVRTSSMLRRRFLDVLDVGSNGESDLASYLLFDGTFASRLIDLGRADAEARRDELLAFFDDEPYESGPPSSGGSGKTTKPSTGWTMRPPTVG
jgi:NTE family protein